MNATSRCPHSTVGRTDKFVDDWDRECEKHRRTLNGTRFTSSVTSHREPERQNWPCVVDNTSCEIQLSLVEQQQKLLNQKKQASAKLQTPLHSNLRNGRSDVQIQSVLNSLDNRPLDEKYISRQASAAHSKSQRDFVCGSDLYRDVGSLDGWAGSADVNRNNRDPSGMHASSVVLGRKHAGELDFDASEEQTKKRQKRLQRLQGSQKPGELYCVCISISINAGPGAIVIRPLSHWKLITRETFRNFSFESEHFSHWK